MNSYQGLSKMVWGNPPKFKSDDLKRPKAITPEQLARSGSEAALQTAVMAWAADNCGQYPQLKYLFHIPNGGSRDVREGVSLKAQGVKRGVPDLMLPYASRGWHGLFIEMKAGKNKPSIDQVEWLTKLSSYGYAVRVCYTWIEARDALLNYLEYKI